MSGHAKTSSNTSDASEGQGLSGTGTLVGTGRRRTTARIVLYALLTVLVLTHAIAVRGKENEFYATILDTITNVFVGDLPTVGFQGYDHLNEAPLFGVDEVGDHLEWLTDVYHHLQDYFPTALLTRSPRGASPPLLITVTQLSGDRSFAELNETSARDFDFSTVSSEWNLTLRCPQGPFTDESCGPGPVLWTRVTGMSVNLHFYNVRIGDWARGRAMPLEWRLSLHYDLSSRYLLVPLSWTIEYSDAGAAVPWTSFHMMVQLSVLVFAVLLLSLSIVELPLIRTVASADDPTPFALSPTTWWTVQAAAEAANAVAALVSLYVGQSSQGVSTDWLIAERVVDAGAYMLLCIALLPLLHRSAGPAGVLDVVALGAAPAARLAVAVFLVFLAFATLGCHIFGGYFDGFSTLDRSIELLFSLMVGDAIFDTFHAAHDGAQGWFRRQLARLFCFTAVAFTYYLVLNQFFAVLEDAYVTAEDTKRGGPDELEDMSVYWGAAPLSARAVAASTVDGGSGGLHSSEASGLSTMSRTDVLRRFGLNPQHLTTRARGDAPPVAGRMSSEPPREGSDVGGDSEGRSLR
eukprot:Hpha_TRINITY_DN12715_c0_g2::TRINITY_DN12715_c0_g2_i1::g.114153::m.114153